MENFNFRNVFSRIMGVNPSVALFPHKRTSDTPVRLFKAFVSQNEYLRILMDIIVVMFWSRDGEEEIIETKVLSENINQLCRGIKDD